MYRNKKAKLRVTVRAFVSQSLCFDVPEFNSHLGYFFHWICLLILASHKSQIVGHRLWPLILKWVIKVPSDNDMVNLIHTPFSNGGSMYHSWMFDLQGKYYIYHPLTIPSRLTLCNLWYQALNSLVFKCIQIVGALYSYCICKVLFNFFKEEDSWLKNIPLFHKWPTYFVLEKTTWAYLFDWDSKISRL